MISSIGPISLKYWVFHSLYNVGRNGSIGIDRFKNTKKGTYSGLNLMPGLLLVYKSNTKPTELLRHVLLRRSLNFCPCTTWFLDLDDLFRIDRAWLNKDPNDSVLQANACLAQLVWCWTHKPVIIPGIRLSPTGGNFFLVVLKSFDATIREQYWYFCIA